MAYGEHRCSIMSGVLMFLAVISGFVALMSYWWTTDALPFSMRATLWRVRVTAMGLIQDDMSWSGLCDRSVVLTHMNIGNISDLCRVLPALRVSVFFGVLFSMASLIMTISLWIGCCSSRRAEKKAKMKMRCFNIRFIFDLLAFIFCVTGAGLGCGVLSNVPATGAATARADAGIYAMCFSALVTFMVAVLTLVQSINRSCADWGDWRDWGDWGDSKSTSTVKMQTINHWRPRSWSKSWYYGNQGQPGYGNQPHPGNFSGAAVPTPIVVGSGHSYGAEMYPQNLNQMAMQSLPSPFPPAQPVSCPLPPQSAQSFPGPLHPQSAPSCQRPMMQTPMGHVASAPYPPQMCTQLVQPQSHNLSLAPPPRPIAAPVQPDFGIGAASNLPRDAVTHFEVKLDVHQSQGGMYQYHV